MWGGDVGRLSALLRTVDLPSGDVVAIIASDGTVLANTLPGRSEPTRSDVRDIEILRPLDSETSGTTNLYVGPETGSYRLAVYRALPHEVFAKGTAHAIIYSIQVSRLAEELFAGYSQVGVEVQVTDRNGVIAVGTEGVKTHIGQRSEEVITAEPAKRLNEPFLMQTATNAARNVAYARSVNTGYTITVSALNSSVLPSLRGHIGRMLVATLIFCLPGTALAVVVSGRLATGINLLATIATGRITQLRPSSIREIDAAANALARAKSAETEAREELHILNASLESRVAEAVLELDRARERTMHARRLETLGSLASGMAHDFGNVLQVVDGCASLIRESLDERLALEQWAEMLEAEVKRGMTVVQRLLSYGRKERLNAAETNVQGLLDNVAEILRHTLPRRISVVVSVQPDLPLLWVDKAQIETVLMNLATNARDAMTDRCTLLLSAELVERDTDTDNARFTRIDVSDTGSGMSSEVLARATEPFFTTKEVGKGTGLGLAMARDFAESSGGRMTIVSELGRGTTVSLFIPTVVRRSATVLPEDGAVVAAPVSSNLQYPFGHRILVIDDLPEVREAISRSLRKIGFEVDVEENGAAVLARVEAGEPLDLVITDYHMPKMRGDDLIRRLHSLKPGLPIILLTGDVGSARCFPDAYELSDCLRLASKPICGHDLAALVCSMLKEAAGAQTDIAHNVTA